MSKSKLMDKENTVNIILYTMRYQSSLKTKEIPLFVKTWKNLHNIMPNEIN
jgi:hypothetical protein